MKILIVGCGSIGKRHIRNLRSMGYDDVIAVDPTESRRGEAERDGAKATYASLDDALAAGPLDAGFVCLPTSMHISTAKILAENDINIFMEKPLDKDLEGADELLAMVEEKNLVTIIGYCLRFGESAVRFKKLLDEGAIGRPLYAAGDYSSYLPDWHPWEDYREFYMAKEAQGGGALLDDSHILDLAHMMLGDFARVYAEVDTLSDLEIDSDDCFDLLLTTKSGVRINLHGDLFSKSFREKFMVVGTEGTLTWEVEADQLVLDKPTESKVTIFKATEDYNEKYIHETQLFLDAIVAKKPLGELDLAHAIMLQKVLVGAKENAGKKAFTLGD